MLKASIFLILSLYAADQEQSTLSTPIPSETPERLIAEGIVDGLPEALTIVGECLGNHKAEATAHIIGCLADPQSPAHKITRGSTLCCIGCCKKKRQ